MTRQMTMTLRISGELEEFVATRVGENGSYHTVGEYIRDLIRHDMQRVERSAFERLKAELQRAFSAPESAFVDLRLEDVLARNRRSL